MDPERRVHNPGHKRGMLFLACARECGKGENYALTGTALQLQPERAWNNCTSVRSSALVYIETHTHTGVSTDVHAYKH